MPRNIWHIAQRAVGLVLIVILFTGCGYYSFTGATVPSHLNTIAIPSVEDESASPFTNLDSEATQMLVERMVRRSRLSLASDEANADAVLTARIVSYTNEPTAVGGGDEGARLNRVTITVRVELMDQVEDEQMLDQSDFTSFQDYDPVTDGEAGERLAAMEALESIADDIFTASSSDW